MFSHQPPRLWLPAYLCCRLNFLIDILTFPLLLTYLHCLLVSKSCFFKITTLFYLWKRMTVFHSVFFMLLLWPSTVPVIHPKSCWATSALVFNPPCLSSGIPFLGTPQQMNQCNFLLQSLLSTQIALCSLGEWKIKSLCYITHDLQIWFTFLCSKSAIASRVKGDTPR